MHEHVHKGMYVSRRWNREAIAGVLDPAETMLAMFGRNDIGDERADAVLFITDQRVFIVDRPRFDINSSYVSVFYGNIFSVEEIKEGINGKIILHHERTKIVFDKMDRGDVFKAAQLIRQQIQRAREEAATLQAREVWTARAEWPPMEGGTSPPPVAATIPEQIRQLAGLRDDGVLTEEEFAATKARLL